MPRRTAGTRPGFTLIELLVVIAIIAILAALVTVAGWRALISMREHSISVEINNLETAVVAYREKNPDRFPDTITQNSGGTTAGTLQQNVVINHIRLLFPRNREGNIFAQDRGDGKPGAFYGKELDPSETLVYFLGGGLYDNPEYPLSGPGQPKKYFEFDPRRLVDLDGDGFPSFIPRYPAGSPPYVYFDSRTYFVVANGSPTTCSFFDATGQGKGYLRPYANDASNQGSGVVVFEEKDKFQIIAPGLDGHYGDLPPGNPPPFKQYKMGTFYTRQDLDNIASFSEGTLESQKP
jgi:prepilin-type N-terminal cleavage/methylation domain-containing protein